MASARVLARIGKWVVFFSDVRSSATGQQMPQCPQYQTVRQYFSLLKCFEYSRTLIRRPLMGRENIGLLSKVVSLLRVPVYKVKANGPTKKRSSLPRWSSYQGGLGARFQCICFTLGWQKFLHPLGPRM